MTQEEELRLSQFRSDMLNILGNMYSELSVLRKKVRPARLFGEKPVEDLMELIAELIANDPARPL
jgi:hypothetical protein